MDRRRAFPAAGLHGPGPGQVGHDRQRADRLGRLDATDQVVGLRLRGRPRHGLWSRIGNEWVIKSTGVLPDGRIATATHILTRVDPHSAALDLGRADRGRSRRARSGRIPDGPPTAPAQGPMTAAIDHRANLSSRRQPCPVDSIGFDPGRDRRPRALDAMPWPSTGAGMAEAAGHGGGGFHGGGGHAGGFHGGGGFHPAGGYHPAAPAFNRTPPSACRGPTPSPIWRPGPCIRDSRPAGASRSSPA